MYCLVVAFCNIWPFATANYTFFYASSGKAVIRLNMNKNLPDGKANSWGGQDVYMCMRAVTQRFPTEIQDRSLPHNSVGGNLVWCSSAVKTINNTLNKVHKDQHQSTYTVCLLTAYSSTAKSRKMPTKSCETCGKSGNEVKVNKKSKWNPVF